MKKYLLISICAILMSTQFTKAQVSKDTIQIKKSTFGTIYLKDKQVLDDKKLFDIISQNPETLPEIKLAKTNNIFAVIFGGAGGFIFGYQLGTQYQRSTPNWGALSAATALIGIAIPLEIARVKHTKRAVSIYNEGNFTKSGKNKLEYHLGISNNGMCLKVSF